MEIGVASNLTNLAIARNSGTADSEQSLNAFGIGRANQPEVELSPQARILQQNEQVQNERQQSLQQNLTGDEDSNELDNVSGTEFVRVSSSVGSAARNNLSAERATEVYQSIQDLL